jgi:dynactin 1
MHELTRSRKLVAEVADLSGQNNVLIPELVEALSDLAVSMSNAVDLAVQVRLVATHPSRKPGIS